MAELKSTRTSTKRGKTKFTCRHNLSETAAILWDFCAESECTLLHEFDCSALSATNTLFECTLLKPTRLLVRGRLAHGKPSYRRIKSDPPINDIVDDR
jgi:hypothetical protein